MPAWLEPALSWLAIILVSGFVLYSAFLKPTTSNKTLNTAPSSHKFENAQIKVYPCGRLFSYDDKASN